ncbi:MAG: SMC-Scp complex subunit ScpB [Alphaproteobacteria bacterium]|nr:SMC-Scp complex subunit ScpB [Alphaproteobacteria bacterium]
MNKAPERPTVAEAFQRLQQAFADHPAAPVGDRDQPSPLALRAAEAILFTAAEPMPAAALAEKLGPDIDVPRVLMTLKKLYAGRGVELVEAGGGWRFQTARDLKDLFVETREQPRKLPKAALETLAVIAYHQPVTRAEIEDIRGVSLSKGSLDLLLEIGWVRPRGRRRSPGRPLTFGTTDAFLSHFGLTSLDALPGKDDLRALGLLDPRAAAQIEVPRPGEAGPDEEPLSAEEDAGAFFVDHLDERDDP